MAKSLKALSILNIYFFQIHWNISHASKYRVVDNNCDGTFDFLFALFPKWVTVGQQYSKDIRVKELETLKKITYDPQMPFFDMLIY